jgi:GNAT superfamily N-acetyltransferase
VTIRPAIDAAIGPSPTGHAFRPATAADLPACARIWRESINDYGGRLNLPEVPDDLGAILRLYTHLRSTDPTGFVVAERTDDPGRPSIEAFVIALVRDRLWFLSMLFVLPSAQGRGLGRALLQAVLPDAGEDAVDWRATATDSAQPISNGLYGSLGIVPRMPLFRMVGVPPAFDAIGQLPDEIDVVPFDEIGGADASRADVSDPDPAGGDGGLRSAALAAEVAALDRDAIGFERAVDHAYLLGEGRRGFLYHDRSGATVGYGYTSESGRVGPIAVRDPALLEPVVGHLVTAVRPRGAFGIWVPGAAGDTMVSLLRAGFRFDGFPVLLCWDRPFADFSRYIPISPGLP